MQLTNRIFTTFNLILCIIYWLIVYPISHFGVYLDDSISGSTINLCSFIFIILVITNCLWYLNCNLVFHKSPIINAMGMALVAVTIPLLIHVSNITHAANMVLPYVVSFLLIFSLHQVRYNEEKRNLFIWLILAGNTVNAILHDASYIFQYTIEVPSADVLLSGIGIIVSMYLLLRSKFSSFDIIGNLFAMIILYLYLIHHINLKVIFIFLPSFIALLVLLYNDSIAKGLAISAVIAMCSWIAYCIGFWDGLSLFSELDKYLENTSAHLLTAKDNFLIGQGFGKFAMTNLESNPNYYTEGAYSTFLQLIAVGGIFAVIPLGIACWGVITISFSKKLSLTKQISNFCLILPFVLATIISSISVFSIPVLIALSYILWYVSCQHCTGKKQITSKDIPIKRVTISFICILCLSFTVTGLISISQFDDYKKNNICDKNRDIVNPLIIGDRLMEYEMECVYKHIKILPVVDWIKLYRKVMLDEIIPFHPRRDYLEHLLDLEEYFTQEEKKEVRDLTEKIYPTLLVEFDEIKNQNNTEDSVNESDKSSDNTQAKDEKPLQDEISPKLSDPSEDFSKTGSE